MMTLIIGGSGSGKSAYAENYAEHVSGQESSLGKDSLEKKKYYLATMQIFDEEGKRKVERHQRLRQGKGFLTIEQPFSIEKALQKMDGGEKTVLLECMSNLTANEMFREDGMLGKEQTADHILKGICRLREEASHLIIVTNNVFEDGAAYDETTLEYIQALGMIHERLAAMADEVVEVVVGIPVVFKKGSLK